MFAGADPATTFLMSVTASAGSARATPRTASQLPYIRPSSFALGRPVATILVPSNAATVIMAIDVSRSMCSTDIPPNRLVVAKEAALSFVQNNTSGRQVGIVAFAGFAELIQPPTTNGRLLEDAIASLIPARRTAIGSAILRSIDAIAEIDHLPRTT